MSTTNRALSSRPESGAGFVLAAVLWIVAILALIAAHAVSWVGAGIERGFTTRAGSYDWSPGGGGNFNLGLVADTTAAVNVGNVVKAEAKAGAQTSVELDGQQKTTVQLQGRATVGKHPRPSSH